MTKAQKAEQQDALAKLRDWIKPGDTIYTILDHVSSSGMSRAIRVVLPQIRYAYDTEGVDPTAIIDGKPTGVDFLHPNWAVGTVLGLKHWKRNGQEQDALILSGAGMDMGFHLVYSLSRALFPDGFACIGDGCPSNDHSNGDRDYTPHQHGDGGYCLKHRWL